MANPKNNSHRNVTVIEMKGFLESKNHTDVVETLEKYGFFNDNIFMYKKNSNFISFAPEMPKKSSEELLPPRDFMIFDIGSGYFWFNKMTPVIISVFIDCVPYWKADNFSGALPRKMKTGKDYSNAVKLKDFLIVMQQLSLEIDKLAETTAQDTSWLADKLMVYQHLLPKVATHVSSVVQQQLVSSVKFIEQGFVFSDCIQLVEHKVSYDDYKESGLDTNIPVEWIIAAVVV